mmetsp:Transcript_11940/g.30618  ORF Transcript_11940/g.30618 Transcript_11940/m.30618 type:complete len:331 (-) Transcript_11940:13-1005(-)
MRYGASALPCWLIQVHGAESREFYSWEHHCDHVPVFPLVSAHRAAEEALVPSPIHLYSAVYPCFPPFHVLYSRIEPAKDSIASARATRAIRSGLWRSAWARSAWAPLCPRGGCVARDVGTPLAKVQTLARLLPKLIQQRLLVGLIRGLLARIRGLAREEGNVVRLICVCVILVGHADRNARGRHLHRRHELLHNLRITQLRVALGGRQADFLELTILDELARIRHFGVRDERERVRAARELAVRVIALLRAPHAGDAPEEGAARLPLETVPAFVAALLAKHVGGYALVEGRHLTLERATSRDAGEDRVRAAVLTHEELVDILARRQDLLD